MSQGEKEGEKEGEEEHQKHREKRATSSYFAFQMSTQAGAGAG